MAHRIRYAATATVVILLVAATPVVGATWHVATDGDDAAPGSATEPFLTIARGLDAAATGDTVLVADGLYAGPGNRDLDFAGKGLTVRSDSGDPAACTIDAEFDDSGAGWIFHSPGGGPAVAIEGLKLTRAAAGAVGLGQVFALRRCEIDSAGTGIAFLDYNFGLSEVTDCRVADCAVGLDNDVPASSLGPEILVERSVFDNCGTGVVIGGATKAADPGAKDLQRTFDTCEFTNNGTAVQSGFEDRITFADCVFRDNGVGFTGWRPLAEFAGCEFSGHTQAAVDVQYPFPPLSLDFASCVFRDNPGNGIVFLGDWLTIADTQILGTGGIGVCAQVMTRFDLTRCVVAGGAGAAVVLTTAQDDWACPVAITGCTIAGNAAGIDLDLAPNHQVAITGTIVAFNSGEGLADSGAAYDSCDVYGNGADAAADSWLAGADGSFAADPLFCDAAGGDYGLAANSPCAPSLLHGLIGAGAVACDGIPAPVLLAVADIPADQGGQVRLTWYRSGYDEADSEHPILGYDVYRRIDAAAAASPREPGAKLLGWDYLLRVPARGDQGYQVVAPTLCDSTVAGGPCESVFLVSAVTGDPLVYFDSAPLGGWSVDNLVPGAPESVAAAYRHDGVILDWDDAPEADFRTFRVYRGDDPDFVPAAACLLCETAASAWTDPLPSPWGTHYKVTAVDFAGNEGAPGAPDPAGISGAGDGAVPARTALLGAAPNPFNPTTTLAFTLAGPGHARLRVFDAAGRLVATLVDGQLGGGRHEKVWDGRDDGGRSVASGVYLYRFEAGGYAQASRLVLLK